MQTNIERLAIWGGPPAFAEKLHVGRPNIGDRDRFLARVSDILDHRWLTNHGPYVREFEQRISDRLGVKHCIAMCNATIALEIVIRALEMTGEVIVPSFTFVATAHALQWQAITPVFCDVDPATHNIDPQRIEQLITPRTTGIIGVHVWGRPCAIEALSEIAQSHELELVFDAAHAFGCSYHGKAIGSFGRAEVLSFHATKFLNSFEGGAIVTNDDALAARIRLMKNFGFAGYDDVDYVGTNGKMSEVSAAMGLTSLESMDEFIATNRRNYAEYQRVLADLPGILLIAYDGNEHCNYQYIVLEVDQATAGLSRDLLMRILWAENVLARRYFHPGCHRMEPYRSFYPNAGLLLAETEKLTDRVLSLPNGTATTPDDIAKIGELVHIAVAHGAEIAERLSAMPPGQ